MNSDIKNICNDCQYQFLLETTLNMHMNKNIRIKTFLFHSQMEHLWLFKMVAQVKFLRHKSQKISQSLYFTLVYNSDIILVLFCQTWKIKDFTCKSIYLSIGLLPLDIFSCQLPKQGGFGCLGVAKVPSRLSLLSQSFSWR